MIWPNSTNLFSISFWLFPNRLHTGHSFFFNYSLHSVLFLHQFQVYNIMVGQSDTLQSDPPISTSPHGSRPSYYNVTDHGPHAACRPFLPLFLRHTADSKSLLRLTLQCTLSFIHLSFHSSLTHPVAHLSTEHPLSASHCAEAMRIQKCQGLAPGLLYGRRDRCVT